MASTKDIKAGSAFVELVVKNGIPQGLRAAQQHLTTFAGFVAKVALSLTAVSAAILGPLAKATKYFLDTGGRMDDLSKRTGIAASRLFQLNYAAEQTGTSLEDLEIGINGMARRGIPIEEFEKLAKEITAIEDQTTKMQRAMEVFGKSGAKLLPLLAELPALLADARKSGILVSDSDVEAADRIGDKFGKLFAVLKVGVFQIGAALAPVLEPALETGLELAKVFTKWVKENKELAVILGGIGLSIAAAGAGLLVLAGTLAAIGITAGGIAALLAFIVTPAGAVASAFASVAVTMSAVLALGGAWLIFTKSGRTAASAILAAFVPLKNYIGGLLKPLIDALRGGEFKKAVTIASLTFKVAFLSVIQDIEKRMTAMVERMSPTLRAGRWAMRKAGEFTRTPLFTDEMSRGLDLEIKSAEARLRLEAKGLASAAGGTGNPEDYAHLLKGAAGAGTSSWSAGGAVAMSFGGTGKDRVAELVTHTKAMAKDMALARKGIEAGLKAEGPAAKPLRVK